MRMLSFRTVLLSLLLALTCAGCFNTRVMSVRTSTSRVAPGGLLYALPKTEVCIDVTLIHHDTSQAPYAAFADEMLAGVPAVDAYRIAGMTVSTRLVADEAHYYYVLPRRTSLQIDRRHLLLAVGMDDLVADDWQENAGIVDEADDTLLSNPLFYNLYDRIDTFYRRGDQPGKPSMLLAKKDSRSLRRQAQDVAAQIGALQEQRRSLVEGDPDDNRSPEVLRYQMQQLDAQIDALTALFVGRDERTVVRFVVTPAEPRSDEAEESQPLFFFSPSRGIVDGEEGDAVAVRYAFHRQGSMRSAARFVRYHTGDASRLDSRNSIKYRSSEPVEFVIDSPLFQLRRTLPVTQYGPILELPQGRVKARFDAATGELIYLSR